MLPSSKLLWLCAGTESCVGTCESSSLMNPNCEFWNLFNVLTLLFSKIKHLHDGIFFDSQHLFVVQPPAGTRPHPFLHVYGGRLLVGCGQSAASSERPSLPPHATSLPLLPLHLQNSHSSPAGSQSVGTALLL